MESIDLTTNRESQPLSRVPRLVYGTAWKKESTGSLVELALNAGFVGIDTAAHPKHYDEKLVGDGIKAVLTKGKIKREDLYIQTKFTKVAAQNPHDLPYPMAANITMQVHASIDSSLRNLCPTSAASDSYIDTLILHSPYYDLADTLEAWRTIETYVPHRIRYLGISNVPVTILKSLYTEVATKPAIVQNRFTSHTRYEGELRKFCAEKDIVYQAFGVLKQNPTLLSSEAVKGVAAELRVDGEIALYLLVMGLGDVSVLNGTKTEARMKAGLDGLKTWNAWVGKAGNKEKWASWMNEFKHILGDDP